MDRTYERILMGIGKAKREDAHHLLQCLAVAIRPLHTEELVDVLAVDFDAGGPIPKFVTDWRPANPEDAILFSCSSLVTIVNIGDSKAVQFSHFSTKEYLTSSRLAESRGDVSQYFISPEPAHTIFAQVCLSVLLWFGDHLDRDTTNKIPLAKYAAKHWVDHARFEGVASQVQDGMKQLFDPKKPHHFTNWVRIYDMEIGRAHV